MLWVPRIAAHRPRFFAAAQMPRWSIHRVVLEEVYDIHKIIATRAAIGGRQVLVRWVGFNHFGDTWEPVSHVWPVRKLTEFLKGFSVSVNLEYPIWLVRDAIARH